MTDSMPNANRLACLLHPKHQEMIIADVEQVCSTMKRYTLESAEGNELAYFEPGSCLPVYVEIDGNIIERPYAISSSPKQSEEGMYQICIKALNGGYVSSFILEHWKKGMKVTVGGPQPGENWNELRDGNHIIVLAGGSGVTPYLSYARAICDGDIDIHMTLIYGVNTAAEILCADEWKDLEARSNHKFKFVPVVWKDAPSGYESGFITLDIVRKYCDIESSTIYVAGPGPMAASVMNFLKPLHLAQRKVRISMGGDSAYSRKNCTDAYNLKIHMAGKVIETKALGNETILRAIEKAGLMPAAGCRSGRCGFCRAMIVSGKTKTAADENGLRKADRKYGFIHPCCTYPESDIEIIVQRA